MLARPRVFVARRIPQPALDLLAAQVELAIWPDELPPSPTALRAALAEADGLLSLLTDRVDVALLDAAPRLRVVSNYAVGYDNIDVAAATARGVLVTNTPDVLSETVADFTMALVLASARRVVEAAQYVHAGQWRTWEPELLLGPELPGATLGLVGLGRIGRAVARRAQGFGMRLLYTGRAAQPEAEQAFGAQRVPLDQLLSESQVVSLHCPLTPETRHLIDRAALARLQPGTLLINTARGGVIDTEALVAALREQPIRAALDVTDPEPLPADHPLLRLPNVLVTPHIASAGQATRTRMALMAAENLLAAFAGRPPHSVVNPQVLAR